jgi:hypothetical protein
VNDERLQGERNNLAVGLGGDKIDYIIDCASMVGMV